MKNIKKLKIIVVMGGISSEREISLKTGAAIYKSLRGQGFNVKSFDLRENNLQKILKLKPDFVFIALHGKWGEDGLIQAFLEMNKIKYSGSGVLSSSLCMNKIFSKKIMIYHGIPTPQFWVWENQPLKYFENKLPVVIKPSSKGSTIGVSIIEKIAEFKKAIQEAKKYDKDILIEKYIKGKELSVGVLGNMVLPVIEIIPKNKFYDYESKYKSGMSEHIIPARIPKKVNDKIRVYALKTFHVLNCRAIARVWICDSY